MIATGFGQNLAGRLEQIDRRDNAADQYEHADREPEAEPLLDDLACSQTVPAEQECGEIEPHPARDNRAHDEQEQVEPGKTGDDRHQLVGYRRDALEQDDPRPVAAIGFAKGIDLVAEAVDVNEPVSNRIIEYRPDEVADQAARHRGGRA